MYDLAECPPYLAPCFPSYLNEKILAGIDLAPGENEIIKYSHRVQFSHSVVSDSLWPHGPQHARHPCPSSTPRVYSNSCPLSQWRHPTISPSVTPCPPAFNLSQHQGLFKWVSSSHQVAKVLEFHLQHQSFQSDFLKDELGGSPCCLRDSQESSPKPQFKISYSSGSSSHIHTWLLEKPSFH